MKTHITGREWEDLSAYLDGQLSPKESARLEAKLQASAELRAALDGLSQTRNLLRSQPALRAPRNFLLTPKMVGEQRKPVRSFQLFPLMRLASGLAVALFILVLAGDLLMSGRQPVVMPVAMRAAQLSAPAAEMKSAPVASAPEVDLAMQVPAPTEAPAEAPAEASTEAFAEASGQLQAQDQPAAKTIEGTALPPAPTLGAVMLQDTGAYPPPPEALAASASSIEGATATAISPETEPLPREQANLVVTVEEAASGAPASQAAWSGWRYLESALALLVLITVAWAIYLRRSREV
jgi:hypothetical protein